ncbi:TetR/AcrR family transcriptional regulator [Williamsia sterculiae]|uniref:Transcriptional regulator, TetR family n=1 Tax=Williamsia sterculiae TaxID=1344003 RepID=A0A1N7H3C1_9NOCA|nr:TetR/AcrR family transcriptional regulator [Williamsia sterculiae]SIS19334.1 transcriptional regulator, TetR family [Williamsia sterculiae]
MVRTYSSELRTERARTNRARVVATASELFVEQGWVQTTMAQVAERSRLTRQTVYQQFDGKLALLDACIGDALSEGTGNPVRTMPAYEAMGVGDRDDRIRAGARWLGAAHQRSARIQSVLDQAAVTDEDAAARLTVRERNRWDEVRWATRLIVDREPPGHVVDAMWVIASRRQWLSLVDDRGWTPARWQDWFVDMVTTTITGC